VAPEGDGPAAAPGAAASDGRAVAAPPQAPVVAAAAAAGPGLVPGLSEGAPARAAPQAALGAGPAQGGAAAAAAGAYGAAGAPGFALMASGEAAAAGGGGQLGGAAAAAADAYGAAGAPGFAPMASGEAAATGGSGQLGGAAHGTGVGAAAPGAPAAASQGAQPIACATPALVHAAGAGSASVSAATAASAAAGSVPVTAPPAAAASDTAAAPRLHAAPDAATLAGVAALFGAAIGTPAPPQPPTPATHASGAAQSATAAPAALVPTPPQAAVAGGPAAAGDAGDAPAAGPPAPKRRGRPPGSGAKARAAAAQAAAGDPVPVGAPGGAPGDAGGDSADPKDAAAAGGRPARRAAAAAAGYGGGGDGEPAPYDDGFDRLLGCTKCRYLKNGCGTCRARPVVERSKAVRWKPDGARPQAGIPPAPTFRPTAAQFADPVAYIDSIRPQAEKCAPAPRAAAPAACLRAGHMMNDAERERRSIQCAVRLQDPAAMLCVVSVAAAAPARSARGCRLRVRRGRARAQVRHRVHRAAQGLGAAVRAGARHQRAERGELPLPHPQAAHQPPVHAPRQLRPRAQGRLAVRPLRAPPASDAARRRAACASSATLDSRRAARGCGGRSRGRTPKPSATRTWPPRSAPCSTPCSAGPGHALPAPAAKRTGRRALPILATLPYLHPAARRYTRPDEETVDGAAAAPEGGGKGDAAAESEFGFVTLDRTHTLKSFASYADWAKALHFSDPLPQARAPALGGLLWWRRAGSMQSGTACQKTVCVLYAACGIGLRGGVCFRGARGCQQHGTAVTRSVPCCCCCGNLGAPACSRKRPGLSELAREGRPGWGRATEPVPPTRGRGAARRRTRRRARPSGASCARTAARTRAWRRSRASSGASWRRPTRRGAQPRAPRAARGGLTEPERSTALASDRMMAPSYRHQD